MLRHKRTCPDCGGLLARIRSRPGILGVFEFRLYECSGCHHIWKTQETVIAAGPRQSVPKRYLPEAEDEKGAAKRREDGGIDEGEVMPFLDDDPRKP